MLLSTTSAVGDSLTSGFSSMADALATAARDPSAAAAGAASSAANWSPSAAFAAATGGVGAFGGSPRASPITNESYSDVYDLGKQVDLYQESMSSRSIVFCMGILVSSLLAWVYLYMYTYFRWVAEPIQRSIWPTGKTHRAPTTQSRWDTLF